MRFRSIIQSSKAFDEQKLHRVTVIRIFRKSFQLIRYPKKDEGLGIYGLKYKHQVTLLSLCFTLIITF